MPEAAMPSMPTQEAAITNTGAIKKKVTTIFVKKKAVAKQKVSIITTKDATNKKVVPTQAVEVTTSDEELLEATVAIELEEDRKMKEKADSDEEFLQAAEAFETLQLLDVKDDIEIKLQEDHHHDSGQGDHPLQQGAQHDHLYKEEGAEIIKMTPSMRLSPRKTIS